MFTFRLSRRTNANDQVPEVPLPEDATVLVVDHEADDRAFAVRVLRAHGYHVLEAITAAHAVDLAARQHQAPILILLTNVILPDATGHMLAEQIISMYPQTVVVFMSNEDSLDDADDILLEPHHMFVHKPLVLATLASTVQEIIGY